MRVTAAAGPGGRARSIRPAARRVAGVAAALAALACVSCSRLATADPPPAPSEAALSLPERSGRALLLEGPRAVRGLPWFGPNALRALEGSYSLGGELTVVFATREPLVFPPAWKAGGEGELLLGEEGGGRALALRRGDYTLIFRPEASREPSLAFARAFDRRFAVFFANARSDAELSFPAAVDFNP